MAAKHRSSHDSAPDDHRDVEHARPVGTARQLQWWAGMNTADSSAIRPSAATNMTINAETNIINDNIVLSGAVGATNEL